MALSVQVTISMPMEMVETIDEQATQHNMSRAAYMRHLARQAEDSPFAQPSERLYADQNTEVNEDFEGAAKTMSSSPAAPTSGDESDGQESGDSEAGEGP